jgi:ketosteroid isomerase-like protein
VTVSDRQHKLLRDLFAAIDSCDSERFANFLTADAAFRFGSAPAVAGREAVRDAVAGFFTTIAGVRHELGLMAATGDTLICEGEVTYTRHDHSTVTLPFADVLDVEDGLISNYKIYIDIAPLYAA